MHDVWDGVSYGRCNSMAQCYIAKEMAFTKAKEMAFTPAQLSDHKNSPATLQQTLLGQFDQAVA